jgi:hypothetical protein
MACPYFYPVERTPQATGKRTPPMPLGDAWSGACRAPATGEWLPDSNTVQQLCNFGYAREKCAHVPGDGPDAVRFGIARDRDGLIRISWVVEKNHLPFAHGAVEYSRASSEFETPPPDPCAARQAEAYLSSYLRRKGDSGRP